MGKNNLKRLKEYKTFGNVIEPTREELISDRFSHKGKWRNYFENENPVYLELGCGKGEYTLALAETFPEKNFIGIDIKGTRIWKGAKYAKEKQCKNVFFLRMQIEWLAYAFEKDEVDEIWITFPDPQVKYKRTKHRLTNPWFLDIYRQILKEEGIVHLKTDSQFLHGYSIGILMSHNCPIIYAHHDLYSTDFSPEWSTKIKTYYEKKYLALGKPITYLQFKLSQK